MQLQKNRFERDDLLTPPDVVSEGRRASGDPPSIPKRYSGAVVDRCCVCCRSAPTGRCTFARQLFGGAQEGPVTSIWKVIGVIQCCICSVALRFRQNVEQNTFV